MPGATGRPIDWTPLSLKKEFFGRHVEGALKVAAGGWYSVEVRVWAGPSLRASQRVDKVGVGEVFVVAGQSNAANSGSTRLFPQEDRVSTWNRRWWQWAGDPQPIATGRGGSPWPLLGDLLARRLHVPVGFVVVAVGGSPVHEWLKWATWRKHGECYAILREAVQQQGGARAVLWHQGETDTQLGTSSEAYADDLRRVIAQSRVDAGYDLPWVVAHASYFAPDTVQNQAAVLEGQRRVIDGKRVFDGPETDDLQTGYRVGVHFNERGLREHARRWETALMKTVLADSPTPAR